MPKIVLHPVWDHTLVIDRSRAASTQCISKMTRRLFIIDAKVLGHFVRLFVLLHAHIYCRFRMPLHMEFYTSRLFAYIKIRVETYGSLAASGNYMSKYQIAL